MATKQQVTKAATAAGLILIENDAAYTWDIEVQAPDGKRIEPDLHGLVVSEFIVPGGKPAFWDSVMQEVRDISRNGLEACTPDCCCKE